MSYEVVELDEKVVAGIKARTSNSDENMGMVIGGLWQDFYNGVYQSLNNKVNGASIGLYSNYENGCMGKYDIMTCCEVSSKEGLPSNVVTSIIPAGKYAKFSTVGDVQKAVCSLWGEIWNTTLDRAYTGDFEEYVDETGDMNNCRINIYVAIK